MLAFLVLVIILLAAMGLVHKSWNVKRDKQDEVDLQSTSSTLRIHARYGILI